MSKQIRTIVFIYEGEEPDEVIIGRMAANLPTDRANSFTFSSKEIAEMFAEAMVKKGVAVNQPCEETTPEDNAVIYIGTVMEQALKEPFDGYTLFRAVMNKVDEFKSHFSEEEHKKLINALFILSQEDLEVSRALLRKYHFSQEKLLIMKKVYNFITSF